MKKINIIPFCMVAVVLYIAGCSKNKINYGDVEKLSGNEALLKVNYVSQYANNRSVFFRINDQRVSAPLTARTPYPGGGYNTGGGNTSDFFRVAAGDVKLSIIQPKKVFDGTDSIVLYTTVFKLEPGKTYTAHITDTSTATKSYVTEENLAKADSSFSRFYFINMMPNVPAIDLYYGAAAATAANQDTDSLLVGNVSYLQPTAQFTLKIQGANKIFKIRPAGSPKNAASILASYTTTSVPSSQRAFCAFASGYSGKVAPSTQRPYISFFLVR